MIVHALLEVTSHPEYDIASMTFNFWHNLQISLIERYVLQVPIPVFFILNLEYNNKTLQGFIFTSWNWSFDWRREKPAAAIFSSIIWVACIPGELSMCLSLVELSCGLIQFLFASEVSQDLFIYLFASQVTHDIVSLLGLEPPLSLPPLSICIYVYTYICIYIYC